MRHEIDCIAPASFIHPTAAYSGRSRSRVALLVCLLAGCQQQMAHQPAYRPLEPGDFFGDGRSARPRVEGTVARGELPQGAFYTGMRERSESLAAEASAVGGAPNPALALLATTATDYIDELPLAADRLGETLRRGQDRFNIFCSPCHDRVGTGRGMVVERGFTPPPSFHTDLARGFKHKGQDVPLTTAPVGYFFEVITHGYGAMPSYRAQVAPADRWAIIAYIRALQYSQNASVTPEAKGGGKQ